MAPDRRPPQGCPGKAAAGQDLRSPDHPEAVNSRHPEARDPDPGRSQPGRLKKRAEFLRVAGKGRKAAVPGLVLQALPRGDEAPARLGFTVTKKVGNAVVRNRTRRRLKEAARLLLRDAPPRGVDLVLIGRDATRARPFASLLDDLRRALERTGVDAAGMRAGSVPSPRPAVLAQTGDR